MRAGQVGYEHPPLTLDGASGAVSQGVAEVGVGAGPRQHLAVDVAQPERLAVDERTQVRRGLGGVLGIQATPQRFTGLPGGVQGRVDGPLRRGGDRPAGAVQREPHESHDDGEQ